MRDAGTADAPRIFNAEAVCDYSVHVLEAPAILSATRRDAELHVADWQLEKVCAH